MTSLSTVFYKQIGVSNTVAALASSIFYAPWVLKPLAGPVVQSRSTRRQWILGAQFLILIFMTTQSFMVNSPLSVPLMSGLFMLIAILGMFHDIAAEGEYIEAQTLAQQTSMIGVRATFFRLGWLAMQGGAMMLVGILGSWQKVIWVYMTIMALTPLILSRTLNVLPKTGSNEFKKIFFEYFKKKEILDILLFLLLFRISEAQLQKLAIPFFMDSREVGGLGMSTTTIGLIYGTLGPIFLTLGGLFAGWLCSRFGLIQCILFMSLALNLSHALYVWLAIAQPENVLYVATLVNIEQFCYGVGFTAYLLFMVNTSRGKNSTAHYAISTGLMSMGMMIPGAWSGWLQDKLGYTNFFIWVVISIIPSIWVSIRAKRVLSTLSA